MSSFSKKLAKKLGKQRALVAKVQDVVKADHEAKAAQSIMILRQVAALYFGKPLPQALLLKVDVALRAISEQGDVTYAQADAKLSEVVVAFKATELLETVKAEPKVILGLPPRAGT